MLTAEVRKSMRETVKNQLIFELEKTEKLLPGKHHLEVVVHGRKGPKFGYSVQYTVEEGDTVRKALKRFDTWMQTVVETGG